MPEQHKPNGGQEWVYDTLREIKDDVKELSRAIHTRIDHVDTSTHARIDHVERSLNQTRELVAGLNVKAGVWGSFGGAIVSIGAAIMALIMALKGGK